MHQILKFITIATVAWVIITPSAHAAKIYRKYHYYTTSGKNAEQLDMAFSQNGVYFKKTGSRHAGASYIRFQTDIKLHKTGKYCRVERANVNIHAKIFLPRWKQRHTTHIQELSIIWDLLSRDIRRHEESHVIIARAHASKMEYAIRSLRYERKCQKLQHNINRIISKISQQHNTEQNRFDYIETKSFEKRFNQLLERRLKALHLRRQKTALAIINPA